MLFGSRPLPLPDELIFEFTDLLDLPSQLALAKTCRFFSSFIKDKFIWQKKIQELQVFCLPASRKLYPTRENFMDMAHCIVERFRQEIDFLDSNSSKIAVMARTSPEVFTFINDSLQRLKIMIHDIKEENYLARFHEINDLLEAINLRIIQLQLPPAGTVAPKCLKLECITRLSEAGIANNQIMFQSTENLELRNNCLRTVPANLSLFSKCDSLNLYNNPICYLPLEFARMKSLKFLYLSDGTLPVIPPCIYALSELKWLSFADMQLRYLSDDIIKLSSLEWLSLQNNQLTFLPTNFYKLTKLKSLALDNNQFYPHQAVKVLAFLKKLRLDLSPNTRTRNSLARSIDVDEIVVNLGTLSLMPRYNYQRLQSGKKAKPGTLSEREAGLRRNHSFF